MIGSKFAKAFIVGMCLTVLSSGVAFASDGQGVAGTGEAQPAVVQGQQAGSEDGLLQKQKEIDEYLFVKHADEIAQKGFTVTHTVPLDGYVEIGITPYTDENASYLYEIFGKDMVKVVEGQQAVLMTTAAGAPDTAVSSSAQSTPAVNEDVLKKQNEIDQYVFEKNAQEIADKGFKVTHTAPLDTYVEIGITPYSEANADYLYGIFGKDMIKVVEGQQAVTLNLSDNNAPMEAKVTASASDSGKELAKTASTIPLPLIYTLGLAILLSGSVIVARKLQVAKR